MTCNIFPGEFLNIHELKYPFRNGFCNSKNNQVAKLIAIMNKQQSSNKTRAVLTVDSEVVNSSDKFSV
jgi:hypothetical protein